MQSIEALPQILSLQLTVRECGETWEYPRAKGYIRVVSGRRWDASSCDPIPMHRRKQYLISPTSERPSKCPVHG